MKRWLFPLVLLALMLTACARQPDYDETTFFAMDTVMALRLYGAHDAQAKAVVQQINTLEKLLSVTLDDSEVARLNAGEALTPSAELRTLLEKTCALSAQTQGCLDPTVYPIVRLWGFTGGDYRVPTQQEITAALSHVGVQHIHAEGDTVSLDAGTQLDFGAVAKGYAAELCAAQLAGTSGILTLGGNVQTVGQKPDGTAWHIGITDPTQPEESIATLALTGTHAIVTSGEYQRFFEEDGIRYSHIMDPKTGASIQNTLASVTVVADSGFLADGLSTALYVMGLDEATRFWKSRADFEVIFITDQGELYVSEGLEDAFSCQTPYQVIHR